MKLKELGLNPRALGLNPRALGINPRALGTNPKALARKHITKSSRTLQEIIDSTPQD